MSNKESPDSTPVDITNEDLITKLCELKNPPRLSPEQNLDDVISANADFKYSAVDTKPKKTRTTLRPSGWAPPSPTLPSSNGERQRTRRATANRNRGGGYENIYMSSVDEGSQDTQHSLSNMASKDESLEESICAIMRMGGVEQNVDIYQSREDSESTKKDAITDCEAVQVSSPVYSVVTSAIPEAHVRVDDISNSSAIAQTQVDMDILQNVPVGNIYHSNNNGLPVEIGSDNTNSEMAMISSEMPQDTSEAPSAHMLLGPDSELIQEGQLAQEMFDSSGKRKRKGMAPPRPTKYRKKSKAGSKEQLTVHHAKLKAEAALRNAFSPDPEELERLRGQRPYASEGALDEEWDGRFDLMLCYGKVHGTYNVPWGLLCKLPNGTEVRLGYWLHEQRQNMKKMKLRADRQKRLQELVEQGKLYWVMDGARARSLVVTDDAGWDMQFDLMLKYGDEHEGNCNVPWGYTCKGPDGSEVKLGYWVKAQRSNRKNGRLRKDRLARLLELVEQGKLRWSKKACDKESMAADDRARMSVATAHMHPSSGGVSTMMSTSSTMSTLPISQSLSGGGMLEAALNSHMAVQMGHMEGGGVTHAHVLMSDTQGQDMVPTHMDLQQPAPVTMDQQLHDNDLELREAVVV